MEKFVYRMDGSPTLVIEAHGELKIKGDDVEEVVINTGTQDNLQVQQNDTELVIKSLAACRIIAPRETTLKINQADGEATIKTIEGEINIDAVHGNLWLRSVGPVVIGSVHGNLEARNVMGSLEFERVDGNCTARDIQGELMAKSVKGNLTVDDIEDGVEARAQGNMVVRIDPNPGEEYVFKAGGNITWSIPDDASAEIQVQKAAKVMANLPGFPAGQKAPFTYTLGDGDASVILEAQGDVFINQRGVNFDFQFETPDFTLDAVAENPEVLADQISRQIDAQMAALEHQLESHMARISTTIESSGMSAEQAERLQRRARESSEQAAQRAQEKMRLAQERLERKMAAVQQRVEQRARQAEERARHAEERAQRRERKTWSFGFTTSDTPRSPIPPIPPVPPIPPIPNIPSMRTRPAVPPVPPVQEDRVTDDERLTVLRMLQQKKITLDQAEKLLAALEGKDA